MLYARFAPTPSGFLHVGNGLNFILTWVYARYFKAKLGLRIDDLDPDRCEQKYVDYIFETLSWLGLSWDEAPFCVSEFNGAYSYKFKEAKYRKFLLHVRKNPLSYVCTCSRKELQSPRFKCMCKTKDLPLIPYESALKFDIQAIKHEDLFGVNISKLENPVLWRKEDIPAYHLASLCDDSARGECLLIRGDDLRESSALQLHIAKSLMLTEFTNSIFIHHPLIGTKTGQKLSKSRQSKPLDLSTNPQFLYIKASEILGLKPCFDAQSLLESFCKNEKSLGFGFKIGGEK